VERNTRQRQAIRAVLEASLHPLSPPELLAAAQDQVPGLSLATVYRTIKSLCDDGIAKAIELPGENPRFERVGKQHHHHFRCRQCARVYEIYACTDLSKLLPPGFALEGHEIVLYGLCNGCNSPVPNPLG
jgi:Fur family transcriptional regulator, ferric uptake regulator